jgi:hypothetical protein
VGQNAIERITDGSDAERLLGATVGKGKRQMGVFKFCLGRGGDSKCPSYERTSIKQDSVSMEKSRNLPKGLLRAGESTHSDTARFLCCVRRKVIFPVFEKDCTNFLWCESDKEGAISRDKASFMTDKKFTRPRRSGKKFY